MICLRGSSLLALCAALVACADGTMRHEIAAPDADAVLALTRPDGDRVFPLVLGAPSADFGTAGGAAGPAKRPKTGTLASAKAAGSARVTGNVDLTYLSSRQTYSFSSQTSAQPPAAQGTVQVSIVHATYHMEIDATIDCTLVTGNEAWISGPVTRFVFNDVARPATIHLLFKVQDNGEGQSAPPDLVSPPFGAAAQACRAAGVLPMFSNPAEHIQLIAR